MKKILFSLLLLFGLTTHVFAASETAIFAGGCFWCMHAEFEGQKGVQKVVSGFTGGHVPNPTYEQVSTGDTGHVEAIQVTFDPSIVTYQQLLSIFWSNIDPTDPDGQFCDKGSQYQAGIFTFNETQQKLALASAQTVQTKLGRPLAAFIKPAGLFYPAEDYHQSYYKKNRIHYQLYKAGCGRGQRLEQLRKMEK